MTWLILFQFIMAIFGPYLADLLKKLLERLFKQTKFSGSPDGMEPEKAIAKLFDKMEANLPRVAPARRLLIGIMKRQALSRAKEIMTGTKIKLSKSEIKELQLVSQVAV